MRSIPTKIKEAEQYLCIQIKFALENKQSHGFCGFVVCLSEMIIHIRIRSLRYQLAL
jgi:hypothetical protein